MSFAWYAE
jgi:hypothetical protein